MTLSKQLVILVVALLLMVFAGTFLISVHNTRDYLERQLESHAQDAATSLGLSITPHLADEDMATVTSMTDAIFDRGYYRQVRIEDIKGKFLVDRVLPVETEGVPAWFISSLPLQTPEGESIVMNGWVQAGKVRVMSHPGFAYNQLWQTVMGTFRWFLFSAAVVLFIGILLLKRVLRPLKQIEWQADAICSREFPILDKLPRTRDLRRIVEAMNRLSEKVHRMLDDLERLAAGLRRKAYQHPVTDLANRSYFMDTLNHLIDSEEDFQSGALLLIQLKDFKAYNDRHGYQAGDDLLKGVAGILVQTLEEVPKHQVAHFSGADFVVLVEDLGEQGAIELGDRVAAALAGLYGAGLLDHPDAGHVGVAYYDSTQSASDLLAQADSALRKAQQVGANQCVAYRLEDRKAMHTRGSSAWRDLISQALEQDQLQLQFQSVVASSDQALMHHEVFVRLPEDPADHSSELMTAGAFMPQAESLGMTAEIDKAVIGKVMALLEQAPARELAINISPASLKDEAFLPWLGRELEARPSVAGRMIFEMAEYGAVSLYQQVTELVSVIQKHGARFALDHFGRSFNSLPYLRTFKAEYLKIDGSFMRSITEGEDNRYFVQAIAEIAHGLDIAVIAEAVETGEILTQLPLLNVDGAQGYYIGRPE